MKNLKIKWFGIGLLELMLALAIIATLLIIATRFFASSSESQKVADADDQINVIQQALNRWLLTYPDFSTLDSNSFDSLVDRNYLPQTYLLANKPKNPWGGDITIAIDTKQAPTLATINLLNVTCTGAQKIIYDNKSTVCDYKNDITCPCSDTDTICDMKILIHTNCSS